MLCCLPCELSDRCCLACGCSGTFGPAPLVGDEPGFRWPFSLSPFDAEEELRAPAPGGVFARAGALEPVRFAAADVASPRAASLGCGLLRDLLRFPWFAAVSSSACSAFTTRSASSCVMAGSSSMRPFPVAKFPSACVRCVSSSSTWREIWLSNSGLPRFESGGGSTQRRPQR